MKEKHIMIFFMSAMKSEPKPEEYFSTDGKFKTQSCQTNETGLKYIEWKLQQKNKKLNTVFAIVTEEAKRSAWPYFSETFKDETYDIIPLDLKGDTDIRSSFNAINMIFKEIIRYQSPDSHTTVHMDFTGGFRHSAMLLLALLQMLHFNGMDIGFVTYTNFFSNPRIIEDANELLNIFDLISGTNEFKAHGLSKQLSLYFPKNNTSSDSLKSLLDAMNLFSERLKICSNIEDMHTTIKGLQEAIKIYELFLSFVPDTHLSPQEALFSKLLPKIKEEYRSVITSLDSPDNALHLILWCLDKELLQQAVTLYSQWLPIFLFRSRLISEPSEAIIQECAKLGKIWKSWEIGFIRKYMPNSDIEMKGSTYTLKKIRDCVDKNLHIEDILRLIPESQLELRTFFEQARQVITNCKTEAAFIKEILHQDDVSPLKSVLLKSWVPNTSFPAFLATRLKNTKSKEEMLLSALKNVPKAFFDEIFHIQTDIIPEQNQTTNRSAVMKALLDGKVITTHLSDQILFRIIDDYNDKIVSTRNTFSHADAKKPDDLETIMRRDIQHLLLCV